MKYLTFFFLFLLFSSTSLTQQIHDIKVPPVNISGPTLQQARDEFWQYHSLAISNYVWHDNNYISINFGLTWPNVAEPQPKSLKIENVNKTRINKGRY